ncbi:MULTISPECIES: hypothetical protein [unclassified Microcoleus]|uniref:hypothetical protein n=1 Tax=unclassified Microcoleus TaxID=2642155 RepID=UPI002FD19020
MRSTCTPIKSAREEKWGREFDGVWVSFLNSPLQSNKQDLSKIEAGKTTLNPKDFDLHRWLNIKFGQIFLDESESMVENQIIQLPNPKGDSAIFANLKLKNRMLLGYAVPIALFVGLVAPVFSSASKGGESYRQTKISMTTREGVDRMAFYLA